MDEQTVNEARRRDEGPEHRLGPLVEVGRGWGSTAWCQTSSG